MTHKIEHLEEYARRGYKIVNTLEPKPAKPPAPAPLPVGEQVAVLVMAVVIACAVLVLLGMFPHANGLLVAGVVVLGILIASQEAK